MPRRRTFVIAIAVAALLVAAMSGVVLARMRQNQPPAPAALTLHSWRLASFTFDGQQQVLVANVAITLDVQSGRPAVTGFNGCNAYGATYSIAGDQLHLSDLYQTLVGCLQPGVADQEARYMTALTQVTAYHLDPSRLTLRDDTGRTTLRYIEQTT